MDINFIVETSGYRLISSGTLMTCDNEPILMTVVLAGEKTICVKLHFHAEKHLDGKSMVRHVSEEGTVDEWDIYESDDGDYGWTVKPVAIICYEEDALLKTLYLQLHSQKVSVDGTVKAEYAWFEGSKGEPMVGGC